MKKRKIFNFTDSNKNPTLDAIHQKITGAAALNGGFDTLLYKIDKIEQGQGHLVSKIDKLHDAIYDPTDGIFVKLAEHKLESEIKLNEIANNVSEINFWKQHREKEEIKDEQFVDNANIKLNYLENSLVSLNQSKERAWSILKWFLAAIGGGIVTLIFAWIKRKFQL